MKESETKSTINNRSIAHLKDRSVHAVKCIVNLYLKCHPKHTRLKIFSEFYSSRFRITRSLKHKTIRPTSILYSTAGRESIIFITETSNNELTFNILQNN